MSPAANWRSLLYVPGNNAKFLAKAQSRGADALILDLEDSVPRDQKQAARDLVAEHFEGLAQGRSALCVRVNGDVMTLADDLRMLEGRDIAAILLPKCDDAGKVGLVAEALDVFDPGGGIDIVPLIESPSGLRNAYEIAAAHRRVSALILGSEDFAAVCGMTPSEQTLLGAKQQIVYAARAAGIVPLGLLNSVAAYSGSDLRDLAARSAAFGFSGATAVHPGAVKFLNQGFSPTGEEADWARRVVSAMETAAKEGVGAVSVDGRMVDKPIAERANAVLTRLDRQMAAERSMIRPEFEGGSDSWKDGKQHG